MDVLVVILALYGLGMCFSLLGSISVKLMPRAEIDEAQFGTLISAFMFTSVITSLIIGVLVDSIGYQPIAIIGFILTGIVIFMLSRGKSYSSALTACILLGFGAMALNTTGNTLAPVVLFGGENPAAATNLANVFFGLGLFFTPIITSSLFNKTTYENTVSVLALIALVPVIFAIFAAYPASQDAGFALGDAIELLANPTIIAAALALFLYIGMEITMNNWLPSYGKEVITGEAIKTDSADVDASAARLISFFAVGMMAGRLIASALPLTSWGGWFIAIITLVAAVVIYIMTVTNKLSVSRIVAAIAGLVFGPIFPTTVGVTYAQFSPEIYGSIFGIIFAVGLLGGVVLPGWIGRLAKGSSVQKGMRILIGACVLLVILSIIIA